MNGYSAAAVFDDADMSAYEKARDLVKALPEQGQSCHTVANLVASALGMPVQRGHYGSVEHSWVVLDSGNLLDVYAVGRFPPVQLVHLGRMLPEWSSYRGLFGG